MKEKVYRNTIVLKEILYLQGPIKHACGSLKLYQLIFTLQLENLPNQYFKANKFNTKVILF